MSHHEVDKVLNAVTPSSHDIAIASEVILEALPRLPNTGLLFEPVAMRLAEEPIPDVGKEIEGVVEAQIRRVRSAAATMTALAHLDARGAILPMGSAVFTYSDWNVPFITERMQTTYRVDGPFNFAVAQAYQLPAFEQRTRLIDSPAVFLEHLPATMGPKVRRVLLEAVDAYRSGLYVSTVVLLGVASEAAWGQLARSIVRDTSDAKLADMVDNQYSSAAAIVRRVVEIVKPLKPKGRELTALIAVEQTYRDLRDYAVHRPDDTFDEIRVARPVVGTLLAGSTDYFQRLYELDARFNRSA